MKNLILAVLLFVSTPVFAAVELDADHNGGTDVGKGGTNATTAAGARTNLGLGNVDNTSDANKPVSSATQTALNLKASKAEALVGDCTVGPCLDGTADGGNYIKLWAGSGSYWTALQGGAPAANRSWRLPIDAAPSAGTTRLMNMDEYGQMGFVDPATFTDDQTAAEVVFTPYLTLASTSVQAAIEELLDESGGGGYTNLTSFVAQTPWRLFYSNTSGDVTELALGADGEYLKSNGAALAPSWATPSGAAHDAVSLGAPANGLSLATQVLSLALSSGSATGALSSTDWTTFNNKLASDGNTSGTAAGLAAQYIDWNAASGGNSIANKPTIPTISDTAYSATTWDANADGASKNAIRDALEALPTLTVDSTLTDGSTNPIQNNAVFDGLALKSTKVANGTSSLGTGAISSGACASVVTTSATGVATTDIVNWGFNGDPTGVTGYAPTANGMLTIIAYPSANNVNYKVCNNTGASITPGAITLNWQVVR